MYLSDAILEYLEYMEIEQNRSLKTIENYHHYLDRLVEFADDIKIDKINPELVRQWRLWLNRFEDEHGQPLSKTTQNYHLIALRSFLRYGHKREWPVMAPDKIELARVKRKQVTFLSPTEVSRLFAQVDTETEPGLRDRAILELLFSS